MLASTFVGVSMLATGLVNMPNPSLEKAKGYWIGRFKAMASPCEILLEVKNKAEARQLVQLAAKEAVRIEEKFSRYRTDNIIYRINHATEDAIEVDSETATLLDYAQQCYALSEGMFDITSGVLREAWHFDGSDKVPEAEAVNVLLPHIGWDKVDWQPPQISLRPGMEIDLGGIGKEYAVDRTARLLQQHTAASLLINYGGDLVVTGARRDGSGWLVGVEDPQHAVTMSASTKATQTQYELLRGGIATSGDARRYLLKDGIRYSHILDPRSGWPVKDAPHSVTVVAGTCTEAGILSTLAMLHGAAAEEFLLQQEVTYWCVR
jgi:thiamine biosynthesis lipoprotein